MRGDPFGAHRVLEPKGALPQAAWKLDNDFSRLYANEILIDVRALNLDAASFRQIDEEAGGDERAIATLVERTVGERGKQHNPVTGSGGMLLGTVRAVGSELIGTTSANVGDAIASLVSLTLTPLRLGRVSGIRRASAQLDVEGQAVLFASSPYAVLPSDLPERLVLAALDVAGAAPQTSRLCEEGDRVLILGAGGKSGLLCAYEARRRVGSSGRVVGIESLPAAAAQLRSLGFCDAVLEVDARDPLSVRRTAIDANDGREFDRAISCINVADAEMSAILPVRDRGSICFFAMTTRFTAAALGAEGAGRDVEMRIGNGYAHGHAEHTLAILRECEPLRAIFKARYGA